MTRYFSLLFLDAVFAQFDAFSVADPQALNFQPYHLSICLKFIILISNDIEITKYRNIVT